jgi:MerR family transcriptional regulator, copper efflux regulator
VEIDGLLTVADVGRRTGLSRKALRLYEELGLVEPAGRTDAGYRLYDDESLRRIELVNRAKVLGLTLHEAGEFLHVAEGCCGDNHPELATLVESKLSETSRRIEELRTLRETLQSVLDRLPAPRASTAAKRRSARATSPSPSGPRKRCSGRPATRPAADVSPGGRATLSSMVARHITRVSRSADGDVVQALSRPA